MILVDTATGSIELLPILTRIAGSTVKVEAYPLQFGDFCFEGKGPDGPLMIGVERKTLHDMMACIQDNRFAGHQMPGMKQHYGVRILMLEGHWKPHDPSGSLMEGFHGGSSWGWFRSRRTGAQTYAQLYRYLISVSLGGFIVSYSRDAWHTAYNVLELYHYFQKPWDAHMSLRELHHTPLASLTGKPSLTRMWGAALPGVGTKISDLAARRFGTPLRLATADEVEWMKIPGVGLKLAQQIFAAIRGKKS